MDFKLFIIYISAFLFHTLVQAQTENYTVQKASFCKDEYDEFSPVYFKNGLVFCSNQNTGLALYSTSSNQHPFKICFVDTTKNAKDQKVQLFAKTLTSNLNDGPVTFTRNQDTIYFSRNLLVKGKMSELSSSRNNLGLFFAVFKDEKWSDIREFSFNNKFYNAGFNITTPFISPDGKRLYFASDMPGGFGGSDIYFCQWENGNWAKPSNLGPVINTSGNEAYPFINDSEELFFSSDKHTGFGGKDIFISIEANGKWLKPINPGEPINSRFDDFGIITDPFMNQGYFSSNRYKSFDILHFSAISPSFFFHDSQKENQNCFSYTDTDIPDLDTTLLQYKWEFGDGNSAYGLKVNHCYKSPGNFNVKLQLMDRETRKIFFSKKIYNFEYRGVEQAYITSQDFAVIGQILDFDGTKSYLPGLRIISYFWDFGDGVRASGPNCSHSYSNEGEYNIVLNLVTEDPSNGNSYKKAVSKKIIIFQNQADKNDFLKKSKNQKNVFPEIGEGEYSTLITKYSADSQIQENTVFRVEILSSKNKIDRNNVLYKKIPVEYSVQEVYNPEEKIYNYYVDQQFKLMDAFPAYQEMQKLGFNETVVNARILQSPMEIELLNINKYQRSVSDPFFDTNESLTPVAYIMLEKIVRLLKKYPVLRIEVAVHSEDTGNKALSMERTQSNSQLLVNYLTERGIDAKRLVVAGYGDSKPVASNNTEKGRKMNKRIDFIIVR